MIKNIAFPLLAGLLAAACAPFGSHDPGLAERVEQQDIKLRQMQPQQADAWNQIQAMQQEINELKGQINRLNGVGDSRLPAESAQQQDAALRQAESGMGLNPPLGEPMQGGSLAAQPAVPLAGLNQGIQTGIGAPDSSAYGAARTVAPTPVPMTGSAQTGSYGLPPDTASGSVEPMQAPSEETWGKADPQPQPTLQVPHKDISLALFDAGVNSFNARDYAAAERSFDDFVKNYPNHSQMAEARFYLAECEFQRNRFPEAALAYDTVIKSYPKSSSAPGAYLKQAICFSKMKQPAAAMARMQEVISKFPTSPEAARAKTFLKTNK